MAVTSLSRFLRAHTCAPPRHAQPTATTRGSREGKGGLRLSSHLARAAVWFLSLCQEEGGGGVKATTPTRDVQRACAALSFIQPGSRYLFSLVVVASLRVPRLSEKRKASGK